MVHIYVITGGRIDIDFALSYIEKYKPDCIIAADKGLEACYKMELMPDHIFGDFDSVKTEIYAYYAERVPERFKKFPSRKDETDTELAVREAILMNPSNITVLGATGTRLDHVYGNLQLLKVALEAGVECQIVDEHNRIRMLNGHFAIREEDQFGEYVSLLPFTPVVEGITLDGFEYPLDDYTMESGLARGVSNEICAEVAEISMKSGILVMFETRD